jgi:MFS family permease
MKVAAESIKDKNFPMTKVSVFMRDMKNCPAFLTFFLVTTFIVSLCIAFIPQWETNDDVAMSMVAHGYGLAAYGSPHLISSNVLWGYLVRTIPTINGVLGYSLATMAVLLVFGWATLYFLIRLGVGYLLGSLAVALLIALPTLMPQFTVNAGLLTVAAVIGWQAHARLGGMGSLVTACLLAFFGFLIRSQEFFLVLGVALPFLPWHALRERRQMQIAFLLLGVAIASAAAFDRWSYSGPEWQHFQELSPARAPFGDFINFGAGEHLKQHPEIMARYGYSQNDINLTENFFSVDLQIANPKSLNEMLAELAPLPLQEASIQSGFAAIKALFSPMLLPLLLPALLFLVLMPRWSMVLAWMLCLAALFTMGVMGRPGILRAYVPLVSLLLVASLMLGQVKHDARQWMVSLTLLAACVGNAYLFIPEALASKQWTQQVWRDIHGLPAGPIVSWGGSFPFELAFPVLANDLNSRNIKLYGLDSFTHAPYSVANTEQIAGRGLIERLQTTAGIPIIAIPTMLEMLRIYCKEHLNGQLHGFVTHQTRSLTVRQVRCVAGE